MRSKSVDKLNKFNNIDNDDSSIKDDYNSPKIKNSNSKLDFKKAG